MALTLPGREDLHREFLDRYSVELPEYDISRGSDPYRLGRVVSGVVWSGIASGDWIVRQLLPDTAEGEQLVRWGNLLGIPRRGAAPAQRTNALRVHGTPGAAVPLNAELAHADGTLYQITAAAVVGGGGTVDCSVVAKTAGSAGNKRAGEVLTFNPTPAQLLSDASLILDLEGGLDLEAERDWRLRIGDDLATPPQGGAIHDYETWAKKVAGVKEAYTYRFRRGLGTIDIAVLQEGNGSGRILADTSPVQTAIDKKRPATVADSLTLTVTPQAQNVTVAVAVDASRFGWDWDDLGVGYAIGAINAPAKQVTAAGLPAGVTVGKRIQVDGEMATVTARAMDTLTLNVWFTASPAGKEIRAYGDLVAPVQTAIRVEFDRLGPARGEYAQGAWEDTLKLYRLTGKSGDVDGVTNVRVETPLADVTPIDPMDAEIPLLVPGIIQVVRMV